MHSINSMMWHVCKVDLEERRLAEDKLSLVKETQPVILAERRDVWCPGGDRMTLFLSVVRHNY